MSNERKPNLFLSLIPLVVLVVAAALSIFYWKAGMFIPLLIGIIVAAIIGKSIGYKWSELQDFLSAGVSRSLPAIFILFIIGAIVGSWILSGIIPTLIYYGLSLISPIIFIPAVCLTTGIISVTTGSSFTSISTVGIAFMAIGEAMGFPGAVVAGAVISGAYFGDKLSPLSDTTNIAPAMVDTDLFSHVIHMLWDTIPAFFIALVLYLLVGFKYSVSASETSNVQNIMNALTKTFNINLLLLIVPVLTIILILKRYPAIPTLIIVSVLGGLAAMIFQGSSITEVITAMTSGFSGHTGVKSIDSLISQGGITSMLGTIGLLTFATAFGGILDGTGMFKSIIDFLAQKAKTTGSLILSTIISTFVVGFASGAQFLAIILPARSFADTYKQRGLDTKNLSRCVEAAGTVGINLVPWGVPAVFAAKMLGVQPMAFIPFTFFAFIVPIINVIYGYTGISIAKKDYPDYSSSSNGMEAEDSSVSM